MTVLRDDLDREADAPPPQTYPELRSALLARYDALPAQLKIVAQYLIDKPNDAALMTIAALSEATGVQPSAFIRFSKAVGFKGFSEIQTILRDNLSNRQVSYAERVTRSSQSASLAPLERFTQSAIDSLNTLVETTPPANIDAGVKLLRSARQIHVVGHRRSWPVASYFAYMMAGFGAATHLFSPTGPMAEADASIIGPGDVLVAVSFPRYSEETARIVEQTTGMKVPVIAITNSRVAPIARQAQIVFEADQDEAAGFRSLASAIVLAQVIAVSYGEAIASEATRRR